LRGHPFGRDPAVTVVAAQPHGGRRAAGDLEGELDGEADDGE
jgi:hypothetical protein